MKLQMTKNSCYDCVLHLQIIYCGQTISDLMYKLNVKNSTIYLENLQTMKNTHNVKGDLHVTVHYESTEGHQHTATVTADWPFWAVQ